MPGWHARFVRRNTTLNRIQNQKRSLRYKRARFYSAELGLFISRDPLGFVDGMSLYRAYFVPGGVDPMGNTIRYVSGEIRPPKKVRDRNGCCKVDNLRLICRTMPTIKHLRGFYHCYLVFEGADGKPVDVLSGQQIDDGLLGLSDSFWDSDYFTGDSPNQKGVLQYEYPVVPPLTAIGNSQSDLCFIYACMYREELDWMAQLTTNSCGITAIRFCLS